MQSLSRQKKDDIPLPVAIALLGVVVFLVFGASRRLEIEAVLQTVENFLNSHPLLISALVCAFIINISTLVIFFAKYFSIKTQGSILKDLTGKGKDTKKIMLGHALCVFKYGSLVWVIDQYLLEFLFPGLEPEKIPATVSYIYKGNIAFACTIVLYLFRIFVLRLGEENLKKSGLLDIPKTTNTITLGAVHECT